MKLTIRESAEDDLDRIFAWIAKDHPRAAAEMVSRIRDRIGLLEAKSGTWDGPARPGNARVDRVHHRVHRRRPAGRGDRAGPDRGRE